MNGHDDTRRQISTAPSAPGETFMRVPHAADDPEGLDIAIAGVPWDGGTGARAGSRHGPAAIRHMSRRLRHLHPTMDMSPFDLCRVGDVGDAPVDPFDQAESLARIEAFYARLASLNVRPVTAGGDHLVTLPILRAIARPAPLGMIQFDAHTDTADASAEGARFSSSTPFRRAVEEGLLDPKRVVQIGIRGTTRTYEKERWARDAGMRVVTMDDLHDIGPDGVIREARDILRREPAYISFDIDAVDPAFAPGTGTPVIGGFNTYVAQRMLRGLRGLNLVGGDLMEVSPPYDIGNCTALAGASLLFEILCLVADARADRTRTRPTS